MYDAAGNPLSIEGRVFEAWIAPAQTKTGVAAPVTEIKVLTFQDGLSLVPPTDGSGNQTVKNTLVHQVSRAFAQANFPRGELTADLLEVVDGARRLFAPVRLFYADPAQIRDFVADRAGITFGQGRQPIVTPVAIAGQAGRRGSGFITGTLPPQPSDGEDGDYFVVERTDQANLVYGPKENGEWPPQPSSTFGVGGVADVPGLPDELGNRLRLDGSQEFTGVQRIQGRSNLGLDEVQRPEDHKLVLDVDDTGAITRALTRSRNLLFASSKTYICGDITVPPGAIFSVGRGTTFRRAVGKRTIFKLNGGYANIRSARFEGSAFDASGLADPAVVGVGKVAASTSTTITVRPGEGARFRAGMWLFVDASAAKGAAEARRITDVTGDTITLHRAFDGVIAQGAKVLADTPLIEVGVFGYAAAVEGSVFRNFIVGVTTGVQAPASAGNSCPRLTNCDFEQYTGAAIIQMEGCAGELLQGSRLDGAHTVSVSRSATAGQTVFAYDWNVSPYLHRANVNDVTLTVSKNGTALVYKTDYTIDPSAGTVTLAAPAAQGDVIVTRNSEWSPRGMLCDGQAGKVNGMGVSGATVMLGHAIGVDIVGAPPGGGGVEYLNLFGFVIDTCSYACVRANKTRGVNIHASSLLYAPYSLIVGSECRGLFVSSFSTSLMPASDIFDAPNDRPNRAEICVAAGNTSRPRINRNGWDSVSGYTVQDNAYERIIWGAPTQMIEDGAATALARSWAADPDTGWWRPGSGRERFVSDGVFAAELGPTGLRLLDGLPGQPAVSFEVDQTSGLYRSNGQPRMAVGGLARFFWGANDVGVINAPFRFQTYTVAGLNALPTANLTAFDTVGCSNGNAGQPCLAVWSGSAWLRLALGAAVSSTA